MQLAILGAGNVGGALGKVFAAKGHDVCFGVRDPASAEVQALLRAIGPRARAALVKDAVRGREVVVLATPWPATRAVVEGAGDLRGKVVIDCTNPLTADLSGLTLGHSTSAAEQVASWATGAAVFKAFNQVGSATMASTDGYPVRPVMFVAGDDAARKPAVLQLVADVGFEPVDAGPLTAARLLEPLAMLWISLAYARGLGQDFAFALVRRPPSST
jgi:predicted dinucleotide-binding enzyme